MDPNPWILLTHINRDMTGTSSIPHIFHSLLDGKNPSFTQGTANPAFSTRTPFRSLSQPLTTGDTAEVLRERSKQVWEAVHLPKDASDNLEMLATGQRASFILAMDQFEAQTMRFKHYSAYSTHEIPALMQHPLTEAAAYLLSNNGTLPWRTHDFLAKYELMLLLTPSEISTNYGGSRSVVWYHMGVNTCVQQSPLTNLQDPTWLLPIERLRIETAGQLQRYNPSCWECFCTEALKHWEQGKARSSTVVDPVLHCNEVLMTLYLRMIRVAIIWQALNWEDKRRLCAVNLSLIHI